MILLWPCASALKSAHDDGGSAWTGFAIAALRAGLLCGALLGLEKLLVRDLSNRFDKAHEMLALLTFAGLYIGILSLLVKAMLRKTVFLVPLLLVAGPLAAIAITQFWLYIDQRDLGWVDTGWRAMGISPWLSFAFWQWIAIGFLWLGLGMLAFAAGRNDPGNADSHH